MTIAVRRTQNRWISSALSFLLCMLTHGHVGAQSSSIEIELPRVNRRMERLVVEPSVLRLEATNPKQQLLVTAHFEDGAACDVTHRCNYKSANAAIATFEGSVVVSRSDGRTDLEISCDGQEFKLPITVEGCQQTPPVHFANDIVPVLSKLGCNSGGCHGRVQGQNGFRLSVFGYDPAADYQSIVEEGRGRRVFPASALNSLMIRKASSSVPHGGGKRLFEGSPEYALLQRWIEQGMPRGSETAAQLARLEVSPADRVLAAKAEQQILATAIFSDGSRRDVSHAAQFASNASAVAEVDNHGLVRCGEQSGEAAITVNYMGKVGVVRIQRPRATATNFLATYPVHNRIDELVWNKLDRMGLAPSEICDDATFLRRLYLDVIGTLPTTAEVREFLKESETTKRSRWIDRVLDRPEYASYWSLKWADILLIDKEKLGDRGAFEFHRWLREQFERNRPYDQWVREIVTATGNSGRNGPVNLYRAADTPDSLARTVSQAFLGVRLECAQCHHHPFDQWSQADFYGLAGFFHGLERKQLATDRTLLYHAGYKPMAIPISNVPVTTRPLGAQLQPDLSAGDPRNVLAQWLTAADNPWFARMFANRLWKQLLGRGLVEPEDDMRLTNPATNEPLLAYLAAQAIERQFDQKDMLRMILNSRVYQTSSVATDSNLDDEQNFSHYYVKRLSAEVMLDAICEVTGVSESFPGQPRGTRAIELWDNRLPSYFLEIFGRPPRNSPCECGRSSEPTMAQALHLTNAPEIESKIAAPNGRIARLLGDPKFNSPSLTSAQQTELVEELTIAALGRPPREKELQVAHRLFSLRSPRPAAEDLLWTLLNSYDFLFIQ